MSRPAPVPGRRGDRGGGSVRDYRGTTAGRRDHGRQAKAAGGDHGGPRETERRETRETGDARRQGGRQGVYKNVPAMFHVLYVFMYYMSYNVCITIYLLISCLGGGVCLG